MKNKSIALLSIILPALVLTSCGCSKYHPSIEKTLSVYSLDDLSSGDIEDVKTGEVEARFNKGEPYVPYLSLKQYASLYGPHFADGVYSTITKKGKYVTWTVTKDNTMYFLTQIDFDKKEVVSAGSLDALYKEADDPRDTVALTYAAYTQYDSKQLGESYFSTYSFADLNIDYFSYMGDYYLPLGFYDLTYSFDSTIYFYYNYKSIYSTREVDSFYEKNFEKRGQLLNVISEMKANKKDSVMPSYLIDLNANLFLYVLNNFYGLRDYKKMNGAINYCQSIGTYANLFSPDDTTRVQAYAETLDRLDDNHTALVAGSFVWNETSYVPRQYGTGCINRSRLTEQLNALRKSKTTPNYLRNEVLYSSDEKTAMFYFNQFIFGKTSEVFNSDGSIKDDAKKYDSYFAFLDAFRNIQNKGGVENVIIDMSTNGGGVLGVLMKLLALISKDNMGNLYYLEASSQQVGIAKTRVDSNQDRAYDTNDCFGDDFNIYLLTSDCSFSCGNAFPCLAKIGGYAKVIGQKSGGGECAVGIHYLPNGEYVYHSSNLHLGYFDDRSSIFTGFEDGAQPDILINDYNDFYDINALANYIRNN